MRLWECGHPYVLRDGVETVEHAGISDMVEHWESTDPDVFVAVRWDWISPSGMTGRGVLDSGECLEVVFLDQRRGRAVAAVCPVERGEEPLVREWLQRRGMRLSELWEPLVPGMADSDGDCPLDVDLDEIRERASYVVDTGASDDSRLVTLHIASKDVPTLLDEVVRITQKVRQVHRGDGDGWCRGCGLGADGERAYRIGDCPTLGAVGFHPRPGDRSCSECGSERVEYRGVNGAGFCGPCTALSGLE